MKALVAPQWVSTHLVRPSEVWLILDLLQHLMHWFFEYSVHHMRSCCLRLPNKILSGSIIMVVIQLEIPLLLRDNLALSLSLMLVFFNPLVLINLIHELAYIGNRFPS